MTALSTYLRRTRFALFTAIAALVVSSPVVRAGSASLSGELDPVNANDVLLVPFAFAGGALIAQSYGFGGSGAAPGGTNKSGTVIAAGGFDTYFSLFAGTGPAATFLVSDDDGTCPPAEGAVACRDSRLVLDGLAAGSYTLAISVFDNMSFAENLGSGTLGDGFIGLGTYFNEDLGASTTSAYAVDLSGEGLQIVVATAPVPEPASWQLMVAGFGLVHLIRRKRNSTPRGIALSVSAARVSTFG